MAYELLNQFRGFIMLHTIKSALNANLRGISIISNNIANSNTTAFKKSNAEFSDMYSLAVANEPNTFSGMGVMNEDPRKQMFQGALKETGRALDLAVSGLGFFTVANENNIAEQPYYTRDGSFNLLRNGSVVTSDGLSLMGHAIDDQGQFNPLVLTEVIVPTTRIIKGKELILTNVNVSASGVVKAFYGLDNEFAVSKLPLASFEDAPNLKSEGNNLFRVTPKSGLPIYGLPVDGNFGEIVPGFLEASNVKITDELVKMMKYQQAFSGSSRMLQTEIEVSKRLTNR